MDNVKYLAGAGNTFAIGENLNITSDIEVISYVADASVDIDGVISISKILDSEDTMDMEYYNADGSRAELCLNGVRCSAKFGYDNNIVESKRIYIVTPSGTISTNIQENNVVTSSIEIPSNIEIKEYSLEKFKGYYINVGNPHFVIETNNLSTINLDEIGANLQKSDKFPNGINVEFFEKIDDKNISARVYERGVGETQSCGSGAIAMYLIFDNFNNLKSNLIVNYPGGKLAVDKNENIFNLSGQVIYL